MGDLVHVARVTAGYAGVPAVRDLSMHVGSGETVVILGPNGAGKSTALRAISGLIPLYGGTIELFGEPAAGRPPHQLAAEGLAHVLESRALFLQLTVAENLRLAARTRGAADLALDVFPRLRELLRRQAGVLSGGEQQMLALAGAFATQPRLLMIDEMSQGLAPVVVSALMTSVTTFAQHTQCGVLMVEQHVASALEIADRAYVLAHGELVADGSAAEIARDLASLQARYLGRI